MKFQLEEIANIYDSLHQTPVYIENGISMVRVTDLSEGYLNLSKTSKVAEEVYNEFTKKYIPKKYDIIMSRVGTYGVCALVNTEERFCLGQNTVIISAKKNKKFLYYYLISRCVKKQIEGFVTGSTQKTISDERKKKIVNILSSFDEKIELNNKINDNLQKFIINLYNLKFSEKENNGKLKDIIKKVNNSVNIKTKNINLKYFPVDALPSNYMLTKEGKENEEAKSSLIEFNKYDILIGAMRVYFHRVCLAAENGITRTTTFVLQPKKREYLYYALITMNNNLFIDYANFTSKGSTMPYAVWENVCEDYEIYIPTIEELESFNKIAESIFEKMIENEKENRELKQLRDTLLPKLMNGEIDLDKIEF